MEKKKASDPSNKDCAYCDTSGAKLMCASCKAAHYCSKACQKQHWKHGHKERCIAPDKRRPQAPSMNSMDKVKSGECPICLDFLSRGTLCTLPCKHKFHQECVEELRKHGVLQACPLCRETLPAGPEKLFEEASRKWVALLRKVDSGNVTWRTLTASQQKDMSDVKNMFTNAANQGHSEAQESLGQMYDFGQGVVQDDKEADYKEAMHWYRRAADQGHANALYNLGVMYHNNQQGVAQDLKEAAQWYRRAADKGYANAQFNLGNMYDFGKDVSQDFSEAVRWYRKAAGQGHAKAQSNLGGMYRDGQGIAQDHKEAVRWYQKAADQGCIEAEYHLGTVYYDGQGVAQNFKEAARWYLKAASHGYDEAQFILGSIYERGLGVSQNHKEAGRWYREAAGQGHARAQHNLSELMMLTRSEATSSSSTHRCACCGRGDENGRKLKLKPCSRCKSQFYCGEECQKKDWKEGHKASCNPSSK